MTTAPEWRGAVGDVWAAEWRRTELAFAGVGAILDAAVADVAPHAGRALDIGCGVGSTALALAQARPDLAITGADLSGALLAVAEARLAYRPNMNLINGDAVAAVKRLAPLDLLVSRHGVMFFPDPAAALAALNRATAPGAPLVFTCFRSRAENDWTMAVETALGIPAPIAAGYAPGPYAFADRAWTTALLAAAGWHDVMARPHDVVWQVGGGGDPVGDALGFFSRIGTTARVLAEADAVTRERLRERLRALLVERCRDGKVTFTAAIWLWTARASGEDTP